MLLMMVQGCRESSAGVKPREPATSVGLTRVITKITAFTTIKNHRAFRFTVP